jgi:hypothetical protein
MAHSLWLQAEKSRLENHPTKEKLSMLATIQWLAYLAKGLDYVTPSSPLS